MPGLRMTNVDVYFNRHTIDEVHALRNVSLDVDSGSMVMIVGSNGAGKSTLSNVIAGSVRSMRGSVWIGDQDVTRLANYRRARKVARVFADPLAGTVGDMSIRDNFAMAMSRGRRRSLKLAGGRRIDAIVGEVLSDLGLGLENRLNESVGKLSSGQRQALTLAMACFGSPEVLLLDEHLSALDPVTKERLTTLTVEAARSVGCVTIMITHSMADAVKLGDRLLVMNGGAIQEDFRGPAKDALTVEKLITKMTASGVELSDRVLLDGEGSP